MCNEKRMNTLFILKIDKLKNVTYNIMQNGVEFLMLIKYKKYIYTYNVIRFT